jgi:hypothetical protein
MVFLFLCAQHPGCFNQYSLEKFHCDGDTINNRGDLYDNGWDRRLTTDSTVHNLLDYTHAKSQCGQLGSMHCLSCHTNCNVTNGSLVILIHLGTRECI